MKLEFSRQIFKKYSNIKFHENPSSGNWVVPCGRTGVQTDRQAGRQADSHTDRQTGRQADSHTDRQTDREAHMTKQIVVAILRTRQRFYFSSRDFKSLTQTKRNYTNKCDSFKVHNFSDGRPLWLTAPGAKKTYLRSYPQFQILYR